MQEGVSLRKDCNWCEGGEEYSMMMNFCDGRISSTLARLANLYRPPGNCAVQEACGYLYSAFTF